MLKWYGKFDEQERIEAEKDVDKHGKELYKLMNKVGYAETIEIFRNKIDARLVRNKREIKLNIKTKFDKNIW